MKYENLWVIPSTNDEINKTDNIFEIVRQQGQYLKEHTNGKIFGKFAKIKKVSPLSTMGAVLSTLATREVLQNDDSNALIDANDFYVDQKYGFEIYNNTYKFRVFEMIISPVYPAHIIIDEGITEYIEAELISFVEKGKEANHYIFESDESLIECLRLIFSSKKVKYILYKLQQPENDK